MDEQSNDFEHGLDLGGERFSYYRDAWRRSWWKIYLLGVALIISLLCNAVQTVARHTPRPIAVTSDARVLTVTPLAREGEAPIIPDSDPSP